MIWTIILCNLDCGRLDRIGFVTEKAIADLRVLVSGHTRMALGNTRMSWLIRVWRRPYAYGRKRWYFERKLVSVGTRKGRLLRVAYAYGIGDTRMSWARKCAIRVWEWAIRVWSWPGLGNTRMAWAVRVWAELGFSWTVVVQFLVV